MMLTVTPGTWTPLANAITTQTPGNMEQLTDGSVIVMGTNAQQWAKLTPDASGSYVNGTWSSIASMSMTRAYNATTVLKDGPVMVLGGQYTSPPYTLSNTNTGEIYNPLTNVWTTMAPFPETNFGDDPTILLPDGRVLAGSMTTGATYIYDPTSDSWSAGPTKPDGDASFGESWTKLPDGTILSVDIWNNVGQTERLDPTTMTWSLAGTTPAAMQVQGKALGPAMMLPDGRLFVVGGVVSNTALYNPSTSTWSDGPVMPGGLTAHHSSAALLPNGNVLFVAGLDGDVQPLHEFEYEPSSNSLTDVTSSGGAIGSPWGSRMLLLPSGQVLAILPGTTQMLVYTPNGLPQASSQPTISSVVANGSHYTLTGTRLNGLSAGASYGADNEMDENYPLVELQATDGSGHVYFARTSNWSCTGVATGSTPVSTDFTLPAYLPYGTYSLTAVANGIASAPVSFTGGYTNEADLAVTNTGPATANEGDKVTYNLSVTNNGPTAATNVVLTDTLGANLKYVSATKSQGTFTQSGSTVTFSFGTLAVGQTVTTTVTAQATEDGNTTNAASATSSLSDANLYNNSATATTAVVEAPIYVYGSPYQFSGKNANNLTVASFTHASGVEPTSAFVATINWGDGSTSTGTISQSGSIYYVKGSHTYAKNSTYTITTTVVEAGASPNLAAASRSSGSVSTATATTGASSSATPSTAPSSAAPTAFAGARDALFASTVCFGNSTGISSSTLNSAGADPVPETDALDALFESLGADMPAAGK